MAAPEFMFTLHLSKCDPSDDMVGNLARSVLRHAGCSAESIAAIAGDLRDSLARYVRTRSCDVAFRTRGGELEVVVSQGGQRVFRAVHQLPE